MEIRRRRSPSVTVMLKPHSPTLMSSRPVPRICLLVMVLILVAATIAACGDDSPSQSDVPSGAVAVVGDEAIAKDELDTRIDAILRSLRGSDTRDALEQADELQNQALTELVREKSLLQEARKQGVSVNDAEVRERFTQAKRQFKSRKALDQFLGDQTQRDLLRSLRVQTLAERVGAAMAEEGIDPQDFEEELQRRWRPRTACGNGYLSARCPN